MTSKAIAVDPALPDAYEVLGELGASSGDALDLFPLEGDVFVGAAVARAQLLAAAGSYDDAVEPARAAGAAAGLGVATGG